MRYLIDTNIFVYMTQDVSSLSHNVRNILSDYTNKIPLISSDRRFHFYTTQGLDLIYNKK